MKSTRVLSGIMIVAWCSALEAQPSNLGIDTLRYFNLQFDRNLQTFLWTGIVGYQQGMGDLAVDFKQTARSRLTRGTRNAILDELGADLWLRNSFSDRWAVAGNAMLASVTDNQQLALGNLSRSRILGGPTYRISDGSDLALLGGYEWASQEETRDRGFSYLGRLFAQNIPLEEFSLSFLARREESRLKPRTLNGDSISISLLREFSNTSSNRISILLNNQQREFYVPADDAIRADHQIAKNIFKRKETEAGVVDTLEVRLSTSQLHLTGGIFSRTIDRGYRFKNLSDPSKVVLDTRILETRLLGGISFGSQLASWLESYATFTYEEREERHNTIDDPLASDQVFARQDLSSKRLANVARRTAASLDLRAGIGEKDSLNFMGSASILRYDTPDSLNTDDRDELLMVFGIEEVHRFSRLLSLSLLADVTLSHLVYVNRGQSANNNWNRILRLRSAVRYTPGSSLSMRIAAEVVANYTVYDFEEQVLSVKSFSFRQASWSDSTVWRIGKKLWFAFMGTIRVYERGILRWKEFRERPENYFLEQSYWPQCTAAVSSRLTVTAGYRFFSQDRYRYEGRSRVLERTIENSGPTASIAWRGRNGGFVAIDGWREAQHVDGVQKQVFSNMSITVGMTL